MDKTFAEFLYDRMVAEGLVEPEEVSEDDLSTAEDCLEQVEDLDSDNIDTYAAMYDAACQRDGETPDWTGFKDYAC